MHKHPPSIGYETRSTNADFQIEFYATTCTLSLSFNWIDDKSRVRMYVLRLENVWKEIGISKESALLGSRPSDPYRGWRPSIASNDVPLISKTLLRISTIKADHYNSRVQAGNRDATSVELGSRGKQCFSVFAQPVVSSPLLSTREFTRKLTFNTLRFTLPFFPTVTSPTLHTGMLRYYHSFVLSASVFCGL